MTCLKSDKISYFKFKVIFLKISFDMSTNNVGNCSVVTTSNLKVEYYMVATDEQHNAHGEMSHSGNRKK